MTQRYKPHLTVAALAVAATIMLAGGLSSTVWAGNLDSPGAPATTAGHMPTLQELYDYLMTGAAPGAAQPFQEPSAGPAATMKTLQQIYDDIKALFDQITVTSGDVLSGKKYFSAAPPWGIQTGSAPAGSNVTGAAGSLSMTIPDGLYSGSKTATANDAALVTGNIKAGATIFGMNGKPEVVDTTEAASPAGAGDILSGKKAFVNGSLVTGTITTQTLSDANATVNAGYYSATTLDAVDADLTAANIKSGVTIFGVAGTLSGVPKTGQTTSYAAGDDGDLEKGAAWPNPRFTDNVNGTVTDNLTGLIWLKNANCWGAPVNWATALAKANGLANGQCSLTDGSTAGQWRLPNVRELQSLIHYGYNFPPLPNTAGTGKWTPGNPFLNVQYNYYWTSTTYAPSATYAWRVHLYDGFVSGSGKSGTGYAWAVR